MNSEMVNKPKNEKPLKPIVNRKARLIVRNLSFKTTEKKLREFFGQYGEIDEVNLLKKPDGKLKGCAFIQYRGIQMAAKALYNTSGKLFLEREIVTDWAVPKDKYVQQQSEIEKCTVKEEISSDNENIEVKNESSNEIDVKDELNDIKSEVDDTEDKQKDIHSSSTEDEDDESEVEGESEVESESEVEEDKNEIESEVKSEIDDGNKRAKVFSNDVTEGKTVFVKNIPFSATNEDLKQCMLQFGRVYYALICKDPFTEHSKGSGFVKFVEKESAEQCLSSGTELTLLGNILDCYPALDKKGVTQKSNSKDTKSKDSRNLYLIKEGVILAGSPAAKGLSKSDMEKRLKLEQWKTQILRNLHMFVSQNRLVIHNIPESWDDQRLKQLFLKHTGGGPKAEITESRIMRDLRNLDKNGVGISKGYGFVTFTKHENALFALRALNNNPNIFTPASRPIVAFSIENKLMVNAKHRRLERSKQKNPLYKDNNQPEPKGVKRKYPFNKDTNKNQVDNKQEFTGTTGKPGMSRLRSKFKLRTQASLHYENLKKDKNLKRKKMQLLTQKQPIKQPKQKMNKRKEKADDFSKLVNKYKSTLASNIVNKSKWYE